MEVAAVLIGLLSVSWLIATLAAWRVLRTDRRARGEQRWSGLSWRMRTFVAVCAVIGCIGGVWLAVQVDEGRERHEQRAR